MKRIDVLLTERGFAPSRQKAQALVHAGMVFVNGKPVQKPAEPTEETAEISVTENAPALKYVGRGGLKLEKALRVFGLDVQGKICADIGASTGGFTDCLLQNDADFVYAVDVGHDQLEGSLKSHPKVCSMEGRNARELTAQDFQTRLDFLCADLSFISLTLLAPVFSALLTEQGQAILLVKPQFEAGRQALSKNGIVRDPKAQIHTVEAVISAFSQHGMGAVGLDYSPMRGGSGNLEFLLALEKNAENRIFTKQIKAVIEQAHRAL